MIVGIIGVGVVGGTLNKWFQEHTDHEIRLYDPPKGHLDFLDGCDAIFVSVPVPANAYGQDTTILEASVNYAKKYCDKIFVRSTVLPTTNDQLGTISMPEFLTERKAYQDMCKYPVLCGKTDLELVESLFPNKQVIMMSNTEAELAKLSHNCFGAMKVTYFNIINELCEKYELEYDKVLKGAMITGFIEQQHTKIALDGKKGYGGKCFPENINALRNWLASTHIKDEGKFFDVIDELNNKYRSEF